MFYPLVAKPSQSTTITHGFSAASVLHLFLQFYFRFFFRMGLETGVGFLFVTFFFSARIYLSYDPG